MNHREDLLDKLRSAVVPDIRGLPSLDHALFLINATKFRMFHLFDEPRFMAKLHLFYNILNPATDTIWFIHFLAIMALGKSFLGEKGSGTTLPGAEYFTRAFVILPDYSFLWRDPCAAAEVLYSMALYLQSIDWRTSAHNSRKRRPQFNVRKNYSRGSTETGRCRIRAARVLSKVPEQESLSSISWVSGYLNLLYHQCIMLATRPFLFSHLETCVVLRNTGVADPMPIQLLLQTCLETAKKTVFILDALHQQTLLKWFLPFDLESAVSGSRSGHHNGDGGLSVVGG
ncbi:uncharacterized protein DSM5745_04548 [Aspergillus mulundensis]|uniref:Transcription factor domain-containing protein n=1 Tax=Aspergillus mulundensis TaxID=1810919 RepID=A0A3D8SD04_9EURO|nr:hypothetical protein DSM5745_04548 [Aspergillus mulundensis]RDW84222.1 hypothetical protein DSM5745_04548 [Aspergillus mulundensis]